MGKVTVKIGFVPSYRFRYTPWCQKMRDDSLAAFAKVPGMQVVVPQTSPDGVTLDPDKGSRRTAWSRRWMRPRRRPSISAASKVDGVILCPLDFGDERSAVKVAEKLRVPVLLVRHQRAAGAATTPGLSRVSDSYCGNLSMASGLYRRKIPFHYAGLFFPDEPAFLAEVKDFVRRRGRGQGLEGRAHRPGGRAPADL